MNTKHYIIHNSVVEWQFFNLSLLKQHQQKEHRELLAQLEAKFMKENEEFLRQVKANGKRYTQMGFPKKSRGQGQISSLIIDV